MQLLISHFTYRKFLIFCTYIIRFVKEQWRKLRYGFVVKFLERQNHTIISVDNSVILVIPVIS